MVRLWCAHRSAVMDGKAGVGAHYFDVVRGVVGLCTPRQKPSSEGSRTERAGGKQPPLVANAASDAAASDAARAHWEHLGARVYGAGYSPGVGAEGKGTVVDFTKVIDGSASSRIRFSLLHSFRFDKWLWMRVGEALPPQAPRRSKTAGLTKGDVKRLVKSIVLQLAEQFFGPPPPGQAHSENPVHRSPKGKGKAAKGSPEQGKGRPAPQWAHEAEKGEQGGGKSPEQGKGRPAPQWAPEAEKSEKGGGKAGKDGKATPPWRRSRGPAGGDTPGSASAALGLQSTSKGKGKPEGAGKGKGKGDDASAEPAPRARARRWQRDGWQQVKWKHETQRPQFLRRYLDRGRLGARTGQGRGGAGLHRQPPGLAGVRRVDARRLPSSVAASLRRRGNSGAR